MQPPLTKVQDLVPVGSVWRRWKGQHKGACVCITKVTPTGVRVEAVARRASERTAGHWRTPNAAFSISWDLLLAFYVPEGYTDYASVDWRNRIREALEEYKAAPTVVEPEPKYAEPTTSVAPAEEPTTVTEEQPPMKVTVDKTDQVVAVEEGPSTTGRRWRFQILPGREFKHTPPPNSAFGTEEKRQEALALYVDRGYSVLKINEVFGLGPHSTTFYGLLHRYGLKTRSEQPAQFVPTRPVDRFVAPTEPGPEPPMLSHGSGKLRWRVSVIKLVVETVEADDLLGLAAHYDGSGAEIVRVERV